MGKADKKNLSGKKRLRVIILGGSISFLFSVLLLLFASLALSKGWFKMESLLKLALASCVVGGFIGALFAVRRVGTKVLPTGFCVGLIQFALFLVLGILADEKVKPGTDQFPLLVACLCSGGLAGLTYKKRGRKRKL